MRLIDADALIEQIKKNLCEPCKKRKGDYNGVRCRACQYGDEIDDIEDAPTVMEWIPCSERLSEKGKDVLVTRHYDGSADGNKSCRYVEIADLGGCDDEVAWHSYSDEYKMHPRNHRVIAWMPLPEPYKEGEE